jgi:NAD(P)-dependent dehydrogenase (short-subunit alcohol dehydrogenase family)
MTIATLRFTLSDQRAFARLSGDFNPVHVDLVAARRVAAGEPIVHGMHLLLRALDAHFKRGRESRRCSVSARFQKPALLGDSIHVQETGHDHLTLTLEGAGPLVEVALGNEEATADARWPVSARRGRERATRTPRVRAFADVSGAQGAIEFSNTPAIRRAFPHLARRLGGDTVAAMAGLSRLVGMECPGRDSLLSAVDLDVTPNAAASRLTWRVSKADKRFGLIRLEVSSACIRGTVDAFLRPPPASTPAFDSVAAQVATGEFAGQRALIVGGSRGLGAATALIIASGGGAPLITFATGRAEVAALQRDAKRSGRHIDVLRFDIFKDPIARLARASGRFGATHLYYFATPRIFARRREPFDAVLFRRFAAFYVTGFADVCAAARGSSSLDVFYPSSTALDEHIRELTEYSAAKAAGEMLCGMLQAATPNLRILVRRLARIATDQTASLIPARALDPVAAMLPIVREMQRTGGGHP